MRRYALIFLAALFVSGCDQATKYQAALELTDAFSGAVGFVEHLGRFADLGHPRRSAVIPVVDGFWDFVFVENPSAAFSSFADWPRWLARPLLLGVPFIAGLFMFLYVRRHADRWTTWGAALVLGGAIGNFADRARLGYVIDFVHWHWREVVSWPVFNVADVAVFFGMLAILWGTRVAGSDAPADGATSPA